MHENATFKRAIFKRGLKKIWSNMISVVLFFKNHSTLFDTPNKCCIVQYTEYSINSA